MPHAPSAAFLIIGNEILSGRTREKNLAALAELLNRRGVRLREAAVVADCEADIVAALNALRAKHDYVFTSGGIGPTHDDITTDAVAAAFGVPAAEHPQALAKLEKFYRARGEELTPARRRMARAPQSPAVAIIDSDFPGAPAYRIGNVFVCAGVPAIFRAMAAAAAAQIPQGEARLSSALRVEIGESVFADALRRTAAQFPAVEIGSYPREENGKYICQVVFSGDSAAAIKAAADAFTAYLREENITYQTIDAPPA